MRSAILRTFVTVVALAPLAAAAVTPDTTPSAPLATSPPALASATAPPPSAPTLTPSPATPARRRTPLPTAAPAPDATDADAPDDAAPADETAPPDDESLAHEAPPAAVPTSAPAAPVRAFRTPEREAPPAFVAPRIELPDETEDAAGGAPAAEETMPPPDRPYIATVTFHAAASTDIDGFELIIIYPRSAGDFVGSRNGVECRKTGDGTMFADDDDSGTLRILVASNRPLGFPFDVVCRFTVEPHAVLTSRLIAVNVAAVTSGRAPADSSALSVSVSAR